MLLLIDNYDSFTYNLYQYLSELGANIEVRRNDQVTLQEIKVMEPDHIVVSPGPCTPNEAGLSCQIIETFGPYIPTLGVCLGHQAIGQVYGGHVTRAPGPMHGKTSLMYHQGQGIFRNLPVPFEANRYHSLIVERNTLPAALEITAETADGIIMGLRHRTYPVEGVQFHPESILTLVGKDLLRNFLYGRDYEFYRNDPDTVKGDKTPVWADKSAPRQTQQHVQINLLKSIITPYELERGATQ